MFLTRLIYCSRLQGIDNDAISQILKSAKINNPKVGVTGMLIFNGTYFLQCLEGARTEVNELYQKILHDQRHTDPVLLDYTETHLRDFSEWDMGYVPWTKKMRKVVLAYSRTDEFNPYELSGLSALGLLQAVSASMSTTALRENE